MAAFSREEILAELDSRGHLLEIDHAYVHLAAARLSILGDQKRWAMILEVLGFFNHDFGHDGIRTEIRPLGNCISQPVREWVNNLVRVTADGPEGPTFEDDNYSVMGIVTPQAKSIRIRDHLFLLNTDAEMWKERKAQDFDDWKPDQINAVEMLRWLAEQPEARELLLASEKELRQWIPADLPLILRLDEWHHPDVQTQYVLKTGTPGMSATFQMLADVLVTGDPSRYQPIEPSNTHWLNWPAAGSL